MARRAVTIGFSVPPEIEAKVAAALERLGAAWELMRIDPGFADTAAFCEKYGVPLDHSGNSIIVASKKEPRKYCACLVLAGLCAEGTTRDYLRVRVPLGMTSGVAPGALITVRLDSRAGDRVIEGVVVEGR